MDRRLPACLVPLLAAGCAGLIPGPDAGGAEARAAGLRHVAYEAPTGRVATVRAGRPDGPRIVYVHGTPGSASNWNDFLVEPVDPDWESIAVDRPGFGDSEPRWVVPSLADQAAALEPLLVARAGRLPVLVGHSLGGPIVLRAAADFPGRVGAVVVVSGNVDPRLEKLGWYNYLSMPFEPVLPRWWRNSNRELFPQRAELVQLAARLEHVTCPVLIVHGRRDGLVPFENTDYLIERLTGARSVERVAAPEADHFLIWDDEEVLRAALGRLLAVTDRR